MFSYRVKDGWGEIKFAHKPSVGIRKVLTDDGWEWDAFYGVWRKERAMRMMEFAKWLQAEMRGLHEIGSVIGGGEVCCTF